VFPEPDPFDRKCFKRLVARNWRSESLRSRPLALTAWKAMRGTLCKAWARRLLMLGPTGLLAWYGAPEALEAAERRVSEGVAAAWRGGGGGGGGGAGAGSPGGSPATAALDAAREARDALFREHFRDNFPVKPGCTMLRVPPRTAGAAFPTPYPLQLVNPGGAGGGAGEAQEEGAARAVNDVLTLCFDTSAARRKWILTLRAHLRGLCAAGPTWALGGGAAAAAAEPLIRFLYLGDAESLAAMVGAELEAEGGAPPTRAADTVREVCVALPPAGVDLAALAAALNASAALPGGAPAGALDGGRFGSMDAQAGTPRAAAVLDDAAAAGGCGGGGGGGSGGSGGQRAPASAAPHSYRAYIGRVLRAKRG
jgi:hypothetical protein